MFVGIHGTVRLCNNVNLEIEKTERLIMANTASAKKAVRKLAARTEVNKANRSRMRTYVRKAEEAIASGNSEAAASAVKEAQPEIMKAVTRGLLKKNTAARKVSRLTKRVKALST